MELKTLIENLKKLPLEETRVDSQEGFECVVQTATLKALFSTLETFFGPAFKPVKQKPNPQALELTSSFGGIRDDQILYYKKKQKTSFMAMIWPWGNGQSATVKIIRC